MQLKEFLEESGLTQRRFWRWLPYFDDWYVSPEELKKTNFREYNPDVIPKVKMLAAVSQAFGGKIHMDVLVEIYNAYDEGFYTIDKGVTIEWTFW